ncbi:hypothetical protein [Streptosporangium sp. OZ121]|uniref:hypothetical protein n=1 Tax=Streptosporangium sp. OZ121 TaxID=3444183 RepID=UPI003F7B085E
MASTTRKTSTTPKATDATDAPTTDAPTTDAPTVEATPTTDAPTETTDAPTETPDAVEVEIDESAVFAERMEALLTTLGEAAKGHTTGNSGPLALCIRSAVENCRPTLPEWAGAIENGLTPYEPILTTDKEGNTKRGGKYAMPPRLKAVENYAAGLEWLGLSKTATLAIWEPTENELISLLAEDDKTAAAIKRATAKDSAAKKQREEEVKATTKNAVAVASSMEKMNLPALAIDTPVRAVVADALASGLLTFALVNAAMEAAKLEFRLSETPPVPAE